MELRARSAASVVESLLRLVDEADRRDIATLARQAENTAGGLMTTDYAWLPPNLTATEALDRRCFGVYRPPRPRRSTTSSFSMTTTGFWAWCRCGDLILALAMS